MKINPLSPKWQHNDPKVRLQSVLSGKLALEVLTQLAKDDADKDVRQAALELIDDTNTLLSLSTEAPSISSAAATRWATLVGADLQHLDVVSADLPAHLLKAIAMHAPAEDFRLRATEYMTADEALGEILFGDNLSRVHQHCVGRLEDEAILQKVQQHFFDRDKNVSRIAKSKLQVLNHSREELKASELAMQEVQDKLTALLAAEHNPDYVRRIDALRHQWHQIDDQSPADVFKPIIMGLIEQCEEKAAAVPDPAVLIKEAVDALIVRCEALRTECMATPNIAQLSKTLAGITGEWPESETQLRDQHTNDLIELVNAERRWRTLLSSGTKLSLDQFTSQLADLNWPLAFPKPTDFDTATQQLEQDITEKARIAAEHLAQHNEVQSAIDKFDVEVTAGHIKAANRAGAKLSKLLETVRPTGAQSTHIQQLQAKLQELKDWQGFATQPKREELCEKMKLLGEDASIALPEKARAIKELQDEWKKLGSSDTRPAQKSWSKFKKLGDLAFAPCAEFFNEQEQARQLNLQEREKICTSLELVNTEHDWSQTDWKSMADIIHRAKTEWRQYANVPRRDIKAIDKRFDEALQPIQTRLRTEQSSNAEKKNALIQEITDLLEQDAGINELVNRAKSAQQNWKSIGITDRRQDQKLWKAFRTQCDAVFTRRDEGQNAAKSAAKETAQQFRDLCNAFDQQLDSDQMLGRGDIAAFRKESGAIHLDKDQSSLQSEASKLIKKAEKLLKHQALANQQQMFQDYQRRCQLLDRLDAGSISQTEFDAELEGEIEGNVQLDANLTKALNARSERAADEQELLIIRLELLAELPSPESSQQARMGYQVERLNRELSLGQKETRSEQEQVQGLLTEWFATKNKLADLLPRFEKIAIKLGLPV
jgi:exonuclease SbcC